MGDHSDLIARPPSIGEADMNDKLVERVARACGDARKIGLAVYRDFLHGRFDHGMDYEGEDCAVEAAVRQRDSICAFIEARATKLRQQAERGAGQWALARHDATLLDAIASDIRNDLDVVDEGTDMGKHVPHWPRMLKRTSVCAYLELSVAELEREIVAGRLPHPVMLGNSLHWSQVEIDAYIERMTGGASVPGDGTASKQSLERMVRGPVTVQPVTRDRYGRVVAQVYYRCQNLACAQIRAGQAVYMVKWDNGGQLAEECGAVR